MRELLDELIESVRAAPVALARVVDMSGAGPREIGATMVVDSSGDIAGSISGGCIDAAIIEVAADVLSTGDAVTEHFGYVADDFGAVGLSCGGEVEVFVERVGMDRLEMLTALRDRLAGGRAVALTTTLTALPVWHLLSDSHAVSDLIGVGTSGSVGADPTEPDCRRPRLFVHAFARPARMVLAGANAFVGALATTGRQLGYRVTIVDARPVFATQSRFPQAHEVVVDWPHRYLEAQFTDGLLDSRSVVCVMTHDPKFDVPALAAALCANPAVFVGALGSRRTHVDRIARLRDAGLTDEQLTRLHSPLGLDLGARTPDETAMSIAAQIIAERGGGTGLPLADLEGPIHRHP